MINNKCCPTAESTNGSQWILHRYRYQIHFLDLIKSETQDHSWHPSWVVYKSQKPDGLFQALSWLWPAKLWQAQEKNHVISCPIHLLFFFHSLSSSMPFQPTENFAGYSIKCHHLLSQQTKFSCQDSFKMHFLAFIISIFFLGELAGPKSSHWIGAFGQPCLLWRNLPLVENLKPCLSQWKIPVARVLKVKKKN